MPKELAADLSATLSQKLTEIESLSIDDRIRLVEAIWEGIEDERGQVTLSPAQLRHLDQRIAAYEANPEDVLSWEEVRDSLAAES